jgi:DNA-binding NtrC family response regulator
MVVDDEAEVLEKVKSYLQHDEIDVVTADNSRQALELMDAEVTFDLILVDTPMPASDKTAFFSMKPDSRLNVEGTGNFLQKPFTKDQLVDFVKEKIGER